MTILAEILSSAPAGVMLYETITIELPDQVPLRFVAAFEDIELGGHIYTGANISIALPAKDASGNQTLRFGFGEQAAEASDLIEAALESSKQSHVTYRQFSNLDTSAPTEVYRMLLKGGSLQGGDVAIDCSYLDALNLAFPRERYNSQNARGVQYL